MVNGERKDKDKGICGGPTNLLINSDVKKKMKDQNLEWNHEDKHTDDTTDFKGIRSTYLTSTRRFISNMVKTSLMLKTIKQEEGKDRLKEYVRKLNRFLLVCVRRNVIIVLDIISSRESTSLLSEQRMTHMTRVKSWASQKMM
eukprot:TRINITY_DN6849_c0_g3_i1.p2 TRINITY_DN6849_c0_g3~~TRINITY_DN6849_c0_g3_i1.p2  ORF type:complete len:143 (-),score=18.15 TRINITY_DN6849_c0_g3_i1:682-1110(-)